MRIVCAIIAGGSSSRMAGREKLFLEVGGALILSRIVARTACQADQVIINANGDQSRFTGYTVVPDARTDIGTPLAGLHAVLTWSSDRNFDAVLTVPSDTPFLPNDLVARLQGDGAAIAASAGQQHYLTGLWPVSLAPLVAQTMGNQVTRMKDWAKLTKARVVEWPVEPYDPFLNINTPDDLLAAERIAAERLTP